MAAMSPTLYYSVTAALVLGVLAGISMMSRVRTARAGNALSALCSALAILVAMYQNEILSAPLIWAAVAAGAAVSLIAAARVRMIQMPQVVALLNGLGGLSSALVAVLAAAQAEGGAPVYIALGALAIGFVTFTGSMVAAGKLAKRLPQRPVVLKAHSAVNGAALLAIVACVALRAPVAARAQESAPQPDEPDAESEPQPDAPPEEAAPEAEIVEETAPGEILAEAKKVIIVPGYGMALAQAQSQVKQLADKLESRGCEVKFAIHPVAGRMPGHMNVLLCEVDVPYDQLYEMDAVNDEFRECDACVVIGASDVVNPAANTAEGTPIYGMPVLKAGEAKRVIVCNFDDKPGYAGVPNPLYTQPNVTLLLGDAKDTLEQLLASF